MSRATDKNLRRGAVPGQGFLRDMSPETTSARGRLGKSKSPWSKGPMCATKGAEASFKRYQSKQK